MALHIRDERAATLARRLAKRRGTTMTRAVVEALQSALEREKSGRSPNGSRRSLAKPYSVAIPSVDARSPSRKSTSSGAMSDLHRHLRPHRHPR